MLTHTRMDLLWAAPADAQDTVKPWAQQAVLQSSENPLGSWRRNVSSRSSECPNLNCHLGGLAFIQKALCKDICQHLTSVFHLKFLRREKENNHIWFHIWFNLNRSFRAFSFCHWPRLLYTGSKIKSQIGNKSSAATELHRCTPISCRTLSNQL